MRIGIDIDDTMGNFSETLFNYALEYDKSLRNKGIIYENTNLIDGKFDWTEEEYSYFYKKYIELTGHNLKPFKDVKNVIDELRKMGHDIIIISLRGEGYIDAPSMTKTWLEKNNIVVDKIILDVKDKSEVAFKENLDYFIDDLPYNCEIVSKMGIKTFLYTSYRNKNYNNKDIERINNWEEFYDRILEYSKCCDQYDKEYKNICKR